MPKLTQTDTWVREYRDLLRQSMEEHHQWSVGEHNGSIRLQAKKRQPGKLNSMTWFLRVGATGFEPVT